MSVAYADVPEVPVPSRRGRLSAHVRTAPALEPPYEPLPERPVLTLVPPVAEPLPFDEPAPRRTGLTEDFWGPQPTARRELSDPRPVARRFLQATLEMLHGRRPARQLQPWTSPALYADLVRAVGSSGPRSTPPAVQSVHVDEPADGVAEISAVIRRGDRCRAVAARFEGIDGGWRCVTLQIG